VARTCHSQLAIEEDELNERSQRRLLPDTGSNRCSVSARAGRVVPLHEHTITTAARRARRQVAADA